ncbi:MAG: DNA polymerase III subunit delta', partial [Calditrichia bacterium]|nr:DNA polymerase III subunit delta' [Calditrichia bacterium]
MEENFLNNINKMHPAQVESFYKSISQKQIGHAYLFYGYEGVGKEAFAIELATHLLCEYGPAVKCGKCTSCLQMKKLWHPDFHYIFPLPSKTKIKDDTISSSMENKAQNPFVNINPSDKNIYIGIETIRTLKNELYKHPQQGDKKIVIIQDIETMRVEGANALLKVLEEPPPYVYFILITSKISRILPTILSRCQLIHFDKPASDKTHEVLKQYISETQAAELIKSLRFSDLNIKKAIYYLQEDFITVKNAAIDFFKFYLNSEWSLAHSILLA